MQLQSYNDALIILQAVPIKDITPQGKAEQIYQAACKVIGIDPAITPSYEGIADKYKVSSLAQYKLQVIRDAVVGEWKDDWNNRSQRKWSAWFWLDKPGFRFGGAYYGITDAFTGSGPRLCFETEEQAEFVGRDCIALYADFMGAELPTAKAA